MLDADGVALAVVLFEMAWAAIAYESTVNHNDDIVAKGLGFIHSVRGKDHGRSMKTFEHLEKTSAGYWVNTSSWLVKELNFWVCNEGHGTDKLPLVSTTEILCSGIRISIKIKGVFDEVLLELDVLLVEAFDLSDEVDALVDGEASPDSIMLGTHTHLVSLLSNVDRI